MSSTGKMMWPCSVPTCCFYSTLYFKISPHCCLGRLFILLYNTPLCDSISFIRFSVHEHLGWFRFQLWTKKLLSTGLQADMRTGTWLSPEYTQEWNLKIVGRANIRFYTIRTNCWQKFMEQFIPQCMEFPHILLLVITTIIRLCIANICLPSGWSISCGLIDLWTEASFHMLAIHVFPLMKLPVHVLCTFLISCLTFICRNCWCWKVYSQSNNWP